MTDQTTAQRLQQGVERKAYELVCQKVAELIGENAGLKAANAQMGEVIRMLRSQLQTNTEKRAEAETAAKADVPKPRKRGRPKAKPNGAAEPAEQPEAL